MEDAAWLRSAVAAADVATQALGLQEMVTVEHAAPTDALGTPTGTGQLEEHPAMVQRHQGVLAASASGAPEVKYKVVITFMRPVSIDAARDKVTLQDGVTGTLYTPQGGLSDPTTGETFLRTVYLRR
jgi:hypothetical protein